MRLAFLMIVCLTLLVSVTAQDKLRTVEKPPVFSGMPPPIEVVEIRLGDEKVIDGKIVAGKDWFRGLNITFKNVSKKNIAWVPFQAFFGKYPRVSFQEFGYPWPVSGGFHRDGKIHPLLRPNDEATVWLDPRSLKQVLDGPVGENADEITAIGLGYGVVIFSDNSVYLRGKLFCRAPGSISTFEPGSGLECP